MLTQTAEYCDGAPDPIDRWSQRVISKMARSLSGRALFPFGSDPDLPFYRWAQETGALWTSPVQLLVHGTQGLMVSIRGAIAIPENLKLPQKRTSPCEDCARRPCLSACPVSALIEGRYDVRSCHDYLDSRDGRECLLGGCKVRLSCPAGQAYARQPAQSAYHMARFHQ